MRIASKIAAPSDAQSALNLAQIAKNGIRLVEKLKGEFDRNVAKAKTEDRLNNYLKWWDDMYHASLKIFPAFDHKLSNIPEIHEAVWEKVKPEFDLLEYIPVKRPEHNPGFFSLNHPKQHPEKMKFLQALAELDNPKLWASRIHDRFDEVLKNLHNLVDVLENYATKPGSPPQGMN